MTRRPLVLDRPIAVVDLTPLVASPGVLRAWRAMQRRSVAGWVHLALVIALVAGAWLAFGR